MATKNNHGGKRTGSGRKPVTDKKQQVSFYPLTSHVEALGGREAASELASTAIIRKAKTILKNT